MNNSATATHMNTLSELESSFTIQTSWLTIGCYMSYRVIYALLTKHASDFIFTL